MRQYTGNKKQKTKITIKPNRKYRQYNKIWDFNNTFTIILINQVENQWRNRGIKGRFLPKKYLYTPLILPTYSVPKPT